MAPGERRQQYVEHRRQVKSEDRGNAEAAEDDPTDRAARLRARTRAQNERQCAQDRGDHGHHDRAQPLVGAARDRRTSVHSNLVFLKADPVWDSIRSDPRFQALIDQMQFPG